MLHYFENLDCTYKFLLSIEMKMQKEKKISYFNVWGRVGGARLDNDAPQTRQKAETCPKRLIRHYLWDATGDALNYQSSCIEYILFSIAYTCFALINGSLIYDVYDMG
jgi:hypothetical protein